MAQSSKRYSIDPHCCEEGYEKITSCQHDSIKLNCKNISLATQRALNVLQESTKSKDIGILRGSHGLNLPSVVYTRFPANKAN